MQIYINSLFTAYYTRAPLAHHIATPLSSDVMHSIYVCVHSFSSMSPGANSKLNRVHIDLPGKMIQMWKSILSCFLSRYHGKYDSAMLEILSPLLVPSLSSNKQNLANTTLSFWKTTFDKADHLVYPKRLRDVFVQLKKKGPLDLQLPDFEVIR